jgi:choline dehydrogenase
MWRPDAAAGLAGKEARFLRTTVNQWENVAMRIFDYIIVGAGSSGSALANRLSASGATVLIIESGGSADQALVKMPRGVGKITRPGDPRFWSYKASQGGNRREEEWLKGHIIGGSSSVNGLVYIRGFPSDYDGWLADGCIGWGWNDIGRCFVELEDHVLGGTATRGSAGPLKISVPMSRNPLIEAIFAAGLKLGIPHVEDINDVETGTTGGLGYQPATIARGRRFTAANAFLDDVLHRPNLTLLSNTRARRVVFAGRRATGVSIIGAAGEEIVHARREVILSAGAIESPKLLQLSGVGPAAWLSANGIPVLHDSPFVGENLMEHLYLPIQYRTTRGSLNHAMRGIGLLRSALAYQFLGKGVLTHAAWEAGGFVRSHPEAARPDGQIGIGLYSMDSSVKTGVTKIEVEKAPGFTIGTYLMHPDSRGSVRIVSANYLDAPRIDANYFATQSDRTRAIALARLLVRMMALEPLQKFGVHQIGPETDWNDDQAVIDAFLTRGGSAYHVSGTCRMGADDKAVLDPRLNVRGCDGLRVVDTSIMPSPVSGNTNGPAMAIGLRAAKFILEDAAR